MRFLLSESRDLRFRTTRASRPRLRHWCPATQRRHRPLVAPFAPKPGKASIPWPPLLPASRPVPPLTRMPSPPLPLPPKPPSTRAPNPPLLAPWPPKISTAIAPAPISLRPPIARMATPGKCEVLKLSAPIARRASPASSPLEIGNPKSSEAGAKQRGSYFVCSHAQERFQPHALRLKNHPSSSTVTQPLVVLIPRTIAWPQRLLRMIHKLGAGGRGGVFWPRTHLAP